MSLYFEKEELLNLLEPLAGAVAKNALTHPAAIECVRIRTEAKTNAIRLSACNADLEIEVEDVTSSIHKFEVDILVDYFKLVQILKLASEGVTLTIKKQKLTIEGGGIWTLPVIKGDDAVGFVHMGDFADNATAAAGEVCSNINTCIQFASTEEDRYTLSGVHFHTRKGVIETAATDTFRIAVCPTQEPSIKKAFNFTLPRKPAAAVAKIFKDFDLLKIETDNEKAVFSASDHSRSELDITAYCRLLDGKFPNYSNIIPDRTEYGSIGFEPEAMLTELEKALVAADSETAKVTICFAKTGIVIFAIDNFRNLYGSSLFSAEWTADDVEISINGLYLKTALKNLDANATICAKSKDDALVLFDMDKTFVISPIASRGE